MPMRILVRIPWRMPKIIPAIHPAKPPMMTSENKADARRAHNTQRLFHNNLLLRNRPAAARSLRRAAALLYFRLHRTGEAKPRGRAQARVRAAM